jgi:hypothetical protein
VELQIQAAAVVVVLTAQQVQQLQMVEAVSSLFDISPQALQCLHSMPMGEQAQSQE